jgi:hypothetical protein
LSAFPRLAAGSGFRLNQRLFLRCESARQISSVPLNRRDGPATPRRAIRDLLSAILDAISLGISFRSPSALGRNNVANASEPSLAEAARQREDLIQICVSAAQPPSHADGTPGHGHWALGCLPHL